MATVKFNEGTKKETKLDLLEGEEVIFVRPPKNTMYRIIPGGCLFFLNPGKNWGIEFVVTNKRLVTIPMPPNKKNYEIESYYFKDMASAKETKSPAPDKMAEFSVRMNQGGSSKYLEGGNFRLMSTMGKALLNFAKDMGTSFANQFAETNAMMQTTSNKIEAESRGDRYYTEIKAKASKTDFSKSGHFQICNYMVELINECIKAANK
jgi:hypothetical protein